MGYIKQKERNHSTFPMNSLRKDQAASIQVSSKMMLSNRRFASCFQAHNKVFPTRRGAEWSFDGLQEQPSYRCFRLSHAYTVLEFADCAALLIENQISKLSWHWNIIKRSCLYSFDPQLKMSHLEPEKAATSFWVQIKSELAPGCWCRLHETWRYGQGQLGQRMKNI